MDNQSKKGRFFLLLLLAAALICLCGCANLSTPSDNDKQILPDVSGFSQKSAVRALERYGYIVEIQTEYSESAEEGTVLRQEPEAGKALEAGGKVVITVSFSRKAVVVSFDANGGSVGMQFMAAYPSLSYGSLPVPERGGYDFLGWFLAPEGGDPVLSDSTVEVEADHTLYAQWKPKEVKLILDPNGGTLDKTEYFVTYLGTFGDLPTPTREEYSFIGWFTDPTMGQQILADDVVELMADTTLYAHWTESACVITLHLGGGQLSETTIMAGQGAAYGDLPTPTRAGYRFDGWYTAESGGEKVTAESLAPKAEAADLYAKWTPQSYTVTLNANGGNLTSGQSTFTVTYGKTYGKLPTPTRTGYVFKGWYTASSSGTRITDGSTVSTAGNHTLYAQWGTGQTTVTFDANGGSVSPSSKFYTAGQAYESLPTPTRSGYTFEGWYTAKTGGTRVTTTSVVPYDSITLYARWSGSSSSTPTSVTVYFSPDGGSVSPTSKQYTSGKAYGSLPTPTKSGYTFDGWYNSSGTKVTTSTAVPGYNHTLYARWNASVPSGYVLVTFDANGGTVNPGSQTYKPGVNYGTMPTPKRSGYTFDGWYSAKTGGYKISANSVVSSINHTLYARWIQGTAASVTITFDACGGLVGINRQDFTIGGTYSKLPTPTREGHTFQGWYTAKTGGTKVSNGDAVTFTSGTTLYARWSINNYSIKWNTDSRYTVTVTRTYSAFGGNGTLNNGDRIYYGDVLTITYTANKGYTLVSNGVTNVTVTGNLTANEIYANVR